MKKLEYTKGITLIALVVTIIVLLILAGVAISMLSGDNGILNKASESVIANELTTVKEKITLELNSKKIEQKGKFDESQYTSIGQLGITSKYEDYIGIYNGKMYITSNASDELKKVAESYGITVAKSNKVENANQVTIEDASKGNIKNYRIYGSSVQDGTPTPDNPVDIESVGDKTKNLFDYNSQIWTTGLLSPSKGSIYENNNYKTTGYIELVEYGKNYMVSFNQTYDVSGTTSNRVCYYDSNKQFISVNDTTGYPDIQRYSYSLNVPQNTKYIRYSVRNTDENIQIEEGTTATDYEPYGYKIPITVNNTTTNIYLDEPLRKIGDYADYIDYKNKKVVRNVGNIILDGTETYTYRENTSYQYYIILSSKKNGVCGLLSSNFKDTGKSWTSSLQRGYIAEYFGSKTVTFSVAQTTVANFKSWLADNKPSLTYVLATPTEESIKLPKLSTNEGINVIEVETEINPSRIEFDY